MTLPYERGRTERGIGFAHLRLDDPWSPLEALPVVFQHGLGLDGTAWNPWVRTLAARHRVVTTDLRGHGTSRQAAQGELSLDVVAQDVLSVLDACGIERCHLVGESFGGTAVLHLAATAGDRIASATVCSTGWKGEWFHNIRGWQKLLAEEGIGSWSELLTAARFDRDDSDPGLLAWVDRLQREVAPGVVWDVAASLLETDLTGLLVDVRVPVLSMLADSPFVDPRNVTELVRHIPHADIVRIAGARHGIFLSHWAECVAVCAQFIERSERALRSPT
jgi:pimeloyl-ACP methyl ester carboxylesterase